MDLPHPSRIVEQENTNKIQSMQSICGETDYFDCEVAVVLWKIFLPLFLFIGVPGNILSLVVLSRKRMRTTTTSVYLRLLAMVDTCVLLLVLPRNLLYYYASISISTLNVFLCKTYTFLNPCCIMISWCILPFITLDRLVQVRYPIWAKEHCTRKSAIIVFVILTLVVVVLNIHTLVFFSLKVEAVSTNSTLVNIKCVAAPGGYTEFRDRFWPVIVLVLASITPVACVIVCNVLLTRTLNNRSRGSLARKSLGRKAKEQKDLRSVTRMLIVVCIFFIISSVPQCIRLIIVPYVFNTGSEEDKARALLLQSVAQLFMYTNNSINFLLYTFSGTVFKKELFSMFKQIRCPIMKRAQMAVYPMEPTPKRVQGVAEAKTI